MTDGFGVVEHVVIVRNEQGGEAELLLENHFQQKRAYGSRCPRARHHLNCRSTVELGVLYAAETVTLRLCKGTSRFEAIDAVQLLRGR